MLQLYKQKPTDVTPCIHAGLITMVVICTVVDIAASSSYAV